MNKSVEVQTAETEDYIDLRDLIGFYMSHLPLLIVAAIIGALITGIYTKCFVPNKYTAVSRMYMVSASSDAVVNLTDLNIGASLSNDYVELMKSRPVMEDVIAKLDLGYSYEQLLDMTSMSIVPNTRIVRISAESTDPQEAMDIANQIALTAKIQLPKVMTAPSPSIAENAVLPTHKSSPSLTKNVLLGSAALLFVLLGILTVLYITDDTVKTSEEFEREFGVMPLTVIPEGMSEDLMKKSDNKDSNKRRGRWLLEMHSKRQA